MNFYLAGRYESRKEILEIAKALAAAGQCVTSRWIEGKHDGLPALQCAQDDIEDIDNADVFVTFSDDVLEPVTKPMRGGKHVEFGYAYGTKTPTMVVVGRLENVFHSLPRVIHFDSVADFLSAFPREQK